MQGRTIAIGDIHGCLTALEGLLRLIDLRPEDTLVPLGDYVDRGSDSKGVLDCLIAVADRCRLLPILGNHDEMMLQARNGKSDFQFWMNCGGLAAVESYGPSANLEAIPASHFRFLGGCLRFHETETHFFAHANYRPNLPLEKLDDYTLRWLSLRDYLPAAHESGKIAVLGHTPQSVVLDMGHLICIDTGCFRGGWLTALDATSGQIWQVDDEGRARGTTTP